MSPLTRLTPRHLQAIILASFLLSLLAMLGTVTALGRQAAVAQHAADQAVTQATAARRNSEQSAGTVRRVTCEFLASFIVQPGDPGFSSHQGQLVAKRAQAVFSAYGCPPL
jgi:hypothetical protein